MRSVAPSAVPIVMYRSTLSSARGLISGPTSVPFARPSPSTSVRARASSMETNVSCTPSCTTRRLVAVQRWPVVPNAPQSTPSSARSRSASSRTIIAFLPPISSDSRLCERPHSPPTLLPVSVEPVNDTRATSGCATIAAPASPLPCTRLMTSGGRPASSRISTNKCPVIGTSSAGLNTQAFPRTSAGNIFHVGIASGKLNGVMIPATPIGRRKLIAHLFRNSLGTVCPNNLRPSVAASNAVSIPSCTSPRVSASGFPISRVITSASSSLRAIRMSPARRSTSPRAGPGVRRQISKPRIAEATAASTSACPESGKWPITSRVSAGFALSKCLPSAGATHWPAMKFFRVGASGLMKSALWDGTVRHGRQALDGGSSLLTTDIRGSTSGFALIMTGGTTLGGLRLVHGDLTREIIGAFYDVYNKLGYGFVESVYQRALPVALSKRGVRCASEVPMNVQFEGVEVGVYRADLIVDRKVIVESKVADKIARVHELQLLNYLRATGLTVVLILNL